MVAFLWVMAVVIMGFIGVFGFCLCRIGSMDRSY